MNRALRPSSLAWLPLCAALLSAPARAEDAPAGEASGVALSEQRAAEAYQAYTRKDYAAAVALYLQAHEAAPSGSILYNVARIYDTKLLDRPLAIVYYRRYIADPGAYVERIEFANQRLKQLRDAEVASSQGAAEADAGSPPVSAAPRRAPAPAAPPPEPPPRNNSSWSGTRWTGVVLGAAGLAALATGAGFGLAAMSKANTAKGDCDGNACVTQRGVDAANAANDAATIANVGFVAGGVLLLGGTTLFIVGARDNSERPRAAGLAWGVSGTW
ncbi:MAG: hypothetical protein QM756_33625 [Polyangiaceae bacterium]